MADGLVDDALGGLKGFFSQSDLNDPRVNSALRQRIAYEMMKKQPYPKTVGEGLAAIGNSIGDIGMANRLARADVAAAQQGVKLYDQANQPTATPPATPPATPTPQASVFDTGTSAVAGLPPVVARDDSEDQPDTATPSPTGAPTLGPSQTDVAAANGLVNPRVRVANALVQQAAGGPQANPIEAGDSRVSQAPSPTPTAGSDTRLAMATPTVMPDIRPAPPQPLMQMAQNLPPARYDYVMPTPPRAQAPAPTAPSPDEKRVERMLIENQGNPYAVTSLTKVLQELQAQRALADKQNAERYQNQLLQERELEMKRQEQIQERAKSLTAGQSAEETLQQQRNLNLERGGFGNMNPTEVYKNLDASKALAQSAASSLKASQEAREAAKGAYLGTGANQRLDIAKLVTGLGFADKGNAIANTETFRAAMQPIVASILHQTSGTSQLSEGELRFAKDAAAGNITLDAKTIPRLLDIIDKRSNELLDRHDKMVNTLFGANPQAGAVYGVERPASPANAVPSFNSEAEAEAARLPPGTKIRINGRNATVR